MTIRQITIINDSPPIERKGKKSKKNRKMKWQRDGRLISYDPELGERIEIDDRPIYR